MTPICHCKQPDVQRETHELRAGPDAGTTYTVTYCRKCGLHWLPEHGSHPVISHCAPTGEERDA